MVLLQFFFKLGRVFPKFHGKTQKTIGYTCVKIPVSFNPKYT